MELSPRRSNQTALIYHAFFNYPLDPDEINKWRTNQKINLPNRKVISAKEKLRRQHYSQTKIRIAQRAARLLRRLPTVKLVAVTGSLAMGNAKKEADIDLMVITSRGTLWTTRVLVYLLLALGRYQFRRAGEQEEKDKLCLNIWLDESDLVWRTQNIFTAHEICQIIPLLNKDATYEQFLWANRWALTYWPHAVVIKKPKPLIPKVSSVNLRLIEVLAYKLQYQYMRPKITRETITPTRALFHPVDWSARLKKRLGRD